MCGIAGMINVKQGEEIAISVLKCMTDAIAHRGPDGEGQWISKKGNVALGHRRLSIIDLSDSAAQPMHYLDRYTMVFNGEIYNYIEIKAQLVKDGYTFRSDSDTEVLLALYDQKKNDCLRFLDGMFAFAIWDEVTQTLFCARDRFGEKPFFYSMQQGRFYFGSEMKALWAAGVKKEPSETMMYNYLVSGYVENPVQVNETFFKDIYKLQPASYLLIKDSEIHIRKYWSIDEHRINHSITESQAKHTFYELFETSVKRRLRSDVPVGSSLSGGLDSSLVVCMIDKISAGKIPQNTFSARFHDAKLDEGKYMQYVIDSTNVKPHFIYPDEQTLVDELDKVCFHQEEPFGSTSILAQYKVFELAKQNEVTVLLDGQGADEVLAGYHYFYETYFTELLQTNPGLAHEEMRKYTELTGLAEYLPVNNGHLTLKKRLWNLMPDKMKALHRFRALLTFRDKFSIGKEFFNSNKSSFISAPDYQRNNLNSHLAYKLEVYGLHTLLRYADRNSMAHSREVRLPFLYHEMVEFLMSLPSEFKIKNGWTKYIMRSTFEDLMPKEIVWRKDKLGYEPPQKKWMSDKQIIERIHESRKKLVTSGILDKSILTQGVIGSSADSTGDGSWRHLMLGSLMQ